MNNPWKPAEYAVLDEHYAAIGANGCHQLLPHRTVASIHQRACARGLKVSNQIRDKNHGLCWPRSDTPEQSAMETAADIALGQWFRSEPASNLTWRIAA